MRMVSIMCAATAMTVTGTVWSHHPHDIIAAIAVSPDFARDQTVLCASPGTMTLLLLSRNGGLTWDSISSGIRGSYFTDAEFAPDWRTSRTIFISTTDGGLQVTRNGGTSWGRPPSGMNGAIHEISVSPLLQDGSYVTFVAGWGGIFRSRDEGRSFELVLTLPGSVHVHALEVSPSFAQDGTVVASTSDQRILVSRSDGSTGSWTESTTQYLVEDIELSPAFATDSLAWLGTWGQGVQIASIGPTGRPTYYRTSGPPDGFVNDVEVVVPQTPGATPNVVYAVTKEDGAFASTDHGLSWFQLPLQAKKTIQTDNHYLSILASPNWHADGRVFCGTYEGMHLAIDHGLRWTEVEVDSVRCGRIVVTSPTFGLDQTVYALGYGSSVMRSRDRGDSWTDCGVGFRGGSVYELELSPEFATDQIAIAGVWHGMRITRDGGDSWTRLDLPQNSGDPDPGVDPLWTIRDVEYSPDFATDRTIYAIGIQGSLYESTDAGLTWHFAYHQLFGHATWALQLSPDFRHDRTMIVAGVPGIFISHDAGRSFQQTNSFGIRPHGLILPDDFTSTGVFYGLNYTRGFVRLTNEGRNMEALSAGFDGHLATSAVLSPDFLNDSTIFAVTMGDGIYHSTDRGLNWMPLGPASPSRPTAFCMAISPDFRTDRTVFLGNFEGHHRSTDAGASWQWITSWTGYDNFRDPWAFAGDWVNRSVPGSMVSDTTESSRRGDTAVLPFRGIGMKLFCAVGPDYGQAIVYVDTVPIAVIDAYAPQTSGYTELASIEGLPYGMHLLEIVVGGTGNPASTGTRIGIDQVRVYYR